MQILKILFLSNILYMIAGQDGDPPADEDVETSTNIIHDFTTTTLIPHTEEPETKSTTNVANIIFDTPEKVIAEVNEAFDDLSRTVNETLENFNVATRDKFDDEIGQLFRDLEREELFNLYKDYCSVDQLTAYEEFQTCLNSVIKLWIDYIHPNIEKSFKEIYRKWIEPFRRDVETNLVTPITTALRFPRGNLDKYIACATQLTPQIMNTIELSYTNVLDCHNMSVNYDETKKFAELIAALYKETAEKFTTCNEDPACFRQYCPKTYILVVRTTSQAVDATSSIVHNFEKEVSQIPECAQAKFSNAVYLALKQELRATILNCVK